MGGGRKSTKNGLAIGVKIGVDAEKSGKNTNLLVIMRMSLYQSISLLCRMSYQGRSKIKTGSIIIEVIRLAVFPMVTFYSLL